jgi:hypothetical protein
MTKDEGNEADGRFSAASDVHLLSAELLFDEMTQTNQINLSREMFLVLLSHWDQTDQINLSREM